MYFIIYLCNRNHSNLYILIWFCQKVHNAYVGLKASLWWPVHIIKSVAKHKLSRYTPPQTQHQSFFRDSSPLLVCTRDGFRLWLPLELPAPIKILKASHVSTDKGKKSICHSISLIKFLSPYLVNLTDLCQLVKQFLFGSDMKEIFNVSSNILLHRFMSFLSLTIFLNHHGSVYWCVRLLTLPWYLTRLILYWISFLFPCIKSIFYIFYCLPWCIELKNTG